MRAFLIGVVMLLAAKGTDPKIVGVWGVGGSTSLLLNADGTGELEGEEFKWAADGKTLTVTYDSGESEKLGYAISGANQLALSMGSTPMVFDRQGGTTAATPAPTAIAKATAAPKATPAPAATAAA